jgi:lanosterol synthase
MASLHGTRFEVRDPELIAELRLELFPQGYHYVDWRRARQSLRKGDIIAPPHRALRVAQDALELTQRFVSPLRRRRLQRELLDHVRFDLRSSDHRAISPVSGLLDVLALWSHDRDDADAARALERLETWFWDDERDGARLAGARSATWDTAFAVQALSHAAPHFDVSAMLERADLYLCAQQIREPALAEDYAAHHRVDPRGGYCFSSAEHGWPVSDCTAEALTARLESPLARPDGDAASEAVDFILRIQNSDGGFGSYEPRRTSLDLEWLNPAEMFSGAMSEKSHVECTASCIVALAAFRERYPDVRRAEIDRAIARAAARLRWAQRPDGSWDAAWGIHFTYGIMFGIRGLRAAGAPFQDPAIRKACRWLKKHQRVDGGWGESHESSLRGHYCDSRDTQVIQTAWALSALLEAHDPNWDAIERAAHFLAKSQSSDGTWARQEPVGAFFKSALLHYEMYRYIFPVGALGLYETRRLERLALAGVALLPRVRHAGGDSSA